MTEKKDEKKTSIPWGEKGAKKGGGGWKKKGSFRREPMTGPNVMASKEVDEKKAPKGSMS